MPALDLETIYLIRRRISGAHDTFVETDLPYGREQAITDILNGHYENITAVYALTPSMGACRDVTLDIAEAVFRAIDASGNDPLEFPTDARRFCRDHGQPIYDLDDTWAKEAAASFRLESELRREESRADLFV